MPPRGTAIGLDRTVVRLSCPNRLVAGICKEPTPRCTGSRAPPPLLASAGGGGGPGVPPGQGLRPCPGEPLHLVSWLTEVDRRGSPGLRVGFGQAVP